MTIKRLDYLQKAFFGKFPRGEWDNQDKELGDNVAVTVRIYANSTAIVQNCFGSV